MNEKIERMKLKGIAFEKGLTIDEIEKIQERYSIKFPKSLIDFYSIGLPVGEGFVNWRDDSEDNIKEIQERLDRPFNGLIWGIENNNFWIEGWEEPNTLEFKKQKLYEILKNEPKPIPVYIHRYILSTDGVDDPAILSMHGDDIIVYGDNLLEYLDNEFIDENNKHECHYSDNMGKWVDIMESY